MRLLPLVGLALLSFGPARAETHAVTIRNGTAETIRGIYFGGGTDSRLRRELPPGAEARITYSTSCRTDIRIGYASGRTEDHPGVEVCTDPRIVAGQDGTAGPAMPQQATTATPAVKAKEAAVTSVAAAAKPGLPVKAPPPIVPPWTGKSITKRFGGME